ncbi:MAG: FHA domain-containing protein [Bradyrhizobium sp.]|nr:FHA domain-containing protein [Bradyrhizobium sp.]
MATYIVRRANRDSRALITHQNSDIFINDETVSSVHGKIRDFGGGRYEFSDNNSTNGTYIREKRGWARISTAELSENDEIRLGTFQTSICDLLGLGAGPSSGRVRLERDPETGQVIEKKVR